MAQKRRSLYVLPLIVLVCSIAADSMGLRSRRSRSTLPIRRKLDQDVASFTKVLALVEQNFAEHVSADKAIYKGAVPGMLRTLDPHSNFFDPKEYQALREDQRAAIPESECRSRRAMARPWCRRRPGLSGLQSRFAPR